MPTLEYGSALSHRARRWVVRAVVISLLLLGTYIVGLLVPVHRVEQALMCRICGRTQLYTTGKAATIRVWSRSEVLTQRELEQLYNRYVALPHQHKFFPYAVESLHGNVWGYGSIGEGGPREPSMAVQEALYAMELDFAKRTLDQRRTIYAELQRCQTKEEVRERVMLEYENRARD